MFIPENAVKDLNFTSVAQLENFRLKVFRMVAEELSFRKAGERLFLSQPAVTQQIKALEDDLGLRLFDRTGGRIFLTRHGTILLGYANKVARLMADAEHKLGDDQHEAAGELLLGASTTIAQYVLPRLLGAFIDEHPRVRFSLRSGNTNEIVKLLLAGKVEIGLIEGPARDRSVHVESFMNDELVLIASSQFESDQLTVAQFVGLTLLMREQGSGSRHVVETALKKGAIALKSLAMVIDLDSTEAIKSAAEAGLGVGFVSRWAISKELELNTLKIVPLQGVNASREFTLITRGGPEPKGPPGAFRRFALDRARLLSKQLRRPARPSRSER